ncbi:hypothetical protein PR048_026673 [Dryococelus australis]|uniref:Uncharacterized protein n=1 Tax=Dryococelus australis TaxID=614101 RepID=A0ABQ9GM12_9NEOP|nr:hypothetical protein PR048_026673 [Dryococelus australis]
MKGAVRWPPNSAVAKRQWKLWKRPARAHTKPLDRLEAATLAASSSNCVCACVSYSSNGLGWCLTLGSRKGTRTPPPHTPETVEVALPAAPSSAKCAECRVISQAGRCCGNASMQGKWRVAMFHVLDFQVTLRLRSLRTRRPIPPLALETKTKSFTLHFHSRTYEDISWLCSCKKMMKLFCWPCLLFSKEKLAWNASGFCDLNNLQKAENKLCHSHIVCLKELKQFGKTHIEFAVSSQYQ